MYSGKIAVPPGGGGIRLRHFNEKANKIKLLSTAFVTQTI
jgi:hypothetical protein